MNIRALNHRDEHLLPECLELLESTQGRNVSNLEYLKKILSPEKGLLLVLENDQQHILAVAGAQILDNHTFEYYLPFGEEIVKRLKNAKVGSLSTMSVHPSLQGQGWGKKLLKTRMDWLEEQGRDVLVGISWVSGSEHNSAKVFERLGFTVINKVENFFVQSSLNTNLLCPVCITAPCFCAGILYVKELEKNYQP